uniref:Uncharacterized protein n=1 Tax=Arundo donax TaxID=35708 RepID=A0A0A9DMU3_ARUDO
MYLASREVSGTCRPGFKLSKSKAPSYSERGSLSDLRFPHSMLITIFPDLGSSPFHAEFRLYLLFSLP